MYWSEWVNSSYNTGGFRIYEDEWNFHVIDSMNSSYLVNEDPTCDSVIQNGSSYFERYWGWEL